MALPTAWMEEYRAGHDHQITRVSMCTYVNCGNRQVSHAQLEWNLITLTLNVVLLENKMYLVLQLCVFSTSVWTCVLCSQECCDIRRWQIDQVGGDHGCMGPLRSLHHHSCFNCLLKVWNSANGQLLHVLSVCVQACEAEFGLFLWVPVLSF